MESREQIEAVLQPRLPIVAGLQPAASDEFTPVAQIKRPVLKAILAAIAYMPRESGEYLLLGKWPTHKAADFDIAP
jgi:hypothetical protein